MVDVSDNSLYTAWVGSNFLQEGYDAADWLEIQQGEVQKKLTL